MTGARALSVAVAGILVLAAGAPLPELAEAQTVRPPGRIGVVTRWRETLEEADQSLLAGEWKRARKDMDRLLDEMCDRIESGDRAGWYLATAAALRGIAQAGLGNRRDALWDWQMAESLHPPYAELDLSSYGSAGAVLTGLLAVKLDDPPERPDDGPAVAPPRKLRAPAPKYPFAKKIACLEEAIVVEAVIDAEGLPRRPKLVSTDHPVLGFAALDVLRNWRFEPATLEGEPVEVVYNLKEIYRIPRCGGPRW